MGWFWFPLSVMQAWLATISLAICKAFDLLDMLKKEEEMLLAVKERKANIILCNYLCAVGGALWLPAKNYLIPMDGAGT